MKIQFTPALKPLKVLADSALAGLHPLHDNRYVATADAHWDWDTSAEDGTLETGSIICTMTDCEYQAHYARLFAAAPELLEACLKIANDPYTTCECAKVVRAAISKAIGQ